MATCAPGSAVVGTGNLLSMFRQGNVVLLQSVASGKGLCIHSGQVSGKGIRDLHSQFTVHSRRNGSRIALQNVADPLNWLQIYDGKTLGYGDGGSFSEFILHEIENTYIALESAVVPGQHVGVSENGEVRLPAKTSPLDPASLFVPFLHSAAVGGQNLPAGWQAMKTPDGKEYFINHITKITSWTLPGENPAPSSNTASHRDRGVASGPDTDPTTTAAPPKGYDVMDMFRGNKIFLIPKNSHAPVVVRRGGFGYPKLEAEGSYNSDSDGENDAEFTGTVTSERKVMLENRHRRYEGTVWTNDAKKLFVMKDPMTNDGRSQFIVHGISGHVVAFESAKFPGHYMTVGRGNKINLEARDSETSDIQFTVRVNGFSSHSQSLRSPFTNKPSFLNKLKDESMIQLYHKPSLLFLCINDKYGVWLSENEDDLSSFVVYRDRGMGRVSITTPGRYYSSLIVSPSGDHYISGLGISIGSRADLYVKESPTGALLLESATYPGHFLYLWNEKYRIGVREFSVFLLDAASGGNIIPRDALN